MTDGDLHEDIECLEGRIAELADAAERCRKLIVAAKLLIAAGSLLLLAAFAGLARGPGPLIGATAALVGGIVVFGANTATRRELAQSIAAAEQARSDLIGRLALRVVSEGPKPG